MNTTIRRCLAIAAVVAGCGVLPSAAQAGGDIEDGSFSCRASALRVSTLIDLEPFVANEQQTPCVDDSAGLLPETTVGPVTVSILTAETNDHDRADAKSSVAKLRISLSSLPITIIEAELLSTTAGARCSSGEPAFSSSSTIAKLSINGQPVVNLDEEATIPLLIGTVYLNENVVTSDSVTRRALRVSTALLEVVAAESIADVHGEPCGPPPCKDDDKDCEKPDDDKDHPAPKP